MLFKKMAVWFLIIAFAVVMGACPSDDAGGKTGNGDGEQGTVKNYLSGDDALNWGVSAQAVVNTLGLQPGNDTTEINLNWYSTGALAGKVAQVRFARGTFYAANDLITETGTPSAAGTANTAHKVTVKGLQPGASYQYAVSSDGTNWGPVYDFKVPAGAFKFAVIADPQLHATAWDVNNRYTPAGYTGTESRTSLGWLDTMQKIVAAGVSFIASGGDQVDTTNNGVENEYTLFYAPPGLRSLPLAPVSGNHDRHMLFNYHYNLPNQMDFTGTAIAETVETSTGRNYFYLYNNILFVVLDTASYANPAASQNVVFPVADAKPYIDRFEKTIQVAKAKFVGKYDWLIVQHHKSTASVGDHLADRDIQGYVEAGFETIMSQENVDFVLAGHDHVYARSYPLSGRDGGKVSVPDKSFNPASGQTWNNPGAPVYLTFTTGSGLKYYQVSADDTFNYTDTLYVKDNTTYPYLGEVTDTDGTSSTYYGSTDYMTQKRLPVSNAAYVQPYIPSYCIAEVNGKTITFSTYPIVSSSGTSPGASAMHSFTEGVPYDVITVTKN